MSYYDLEQVTWYWHSVSRETIEQNMRNQPDGTWLVRDSSTAGQFTLVLRHHQSNELIKIYRDNSTNKFSFAPNDVLQFETISQLIAYFQKNSLNLYNQSLDLKLDEPLNRPVCALDNESKEDLINSLRNLHAKYLFLSREYDEKFNDHQCQLQAVADKQQALSAFDHTIKLFRDHVVLSELMQSKAQPHEQRRMADNLSYLHHKVEEVVSSRQKLENEIFNNSERVRKLESSTNQLKQRLLNALVHRRQYQDALSLRGMRSQSMETLLLEVSKEPERYCNVVELFDENVASNQAAAAGVGKNDVSSTSYVEVLANVMQQKLWFVDWPRQRCDSILSNKPTGTFLIRPSSQPGCYALSVMCNGTVHHCLIESQNGRFGFGGRFDFGSLQELINHYACNSLSTNNAELQCSLKFPVLQEHCEN